MKIKTSLSLQHIAFIMDGNGRWATHRGLPRKFGHKAGVDAVKFQTWKTELIISKGTEMAEYQKSDLVKMDMLLNGEVCDALSIIVHKEKAYERGRNIAERLKEVIPRQMFEIPIQAVIGGKIIARETVKAYRKDVLAKCYGGDITRKKKLLEKQKEGKKRMRQVGSVQVPSEAFMSILKIDDK